jgi:hypothetical protein
MDMLRPHAPRKLAYGVMEFKVHKGSGYGLLACSWWQVQSGLTLYAVRFGTMDLLPAFWGVVGSIASIVALLYIYVKVFK